MLWPDVCIKLMYDHSVILVVFEQHCHRVRMGPGILLWHFPGLESPGKGLLVLESSGNLLNSSQKI